jgi:hypothetical protein
MKKKNNNFINVKKIKKKNQKIEKMCQFVSIVPNRLKGISQP